MLRVGLTGGIASGKSAVARQLRSLGLAVLDTDEIARRVVEPGGAAFAEIIERFGAEVVGPDGALDRTALGRIVFADPEARAALESITHPRIVREALRWFDDLERGGATLAVIEVPLLYEAGLEGLFHRVVVVSSSREAQRARAAVRDGLTEGEVDARLGAQMPLGQKAERADHVIENEGTLDELGAAVTELAEQLAELARRGSW